MCSIRLIAVIMLFANFAFSQEQSVLILENFEQTTERWSIESHRRQINTPPLAQLQLINLTPPNGGKQAGLFIWRKSYETEWARFTISLDGTQLDVRSAKGLTFWWLGDGSDAKVTLSLITTDKGGEQSFRKELQLPSNWKQERIVWDEFVNEQGKPVTAFVHSIKELRIERIGPFEPFFFCLDQLIAELSERPKLVTTEVFVNFQKERGTNLLRWGSYWDKTALSLTSDPLIRKRISDLNLGWAVLSIKEISYQSDFESSAQWVEQWVSVVKALGMVPVLNLSPNKPEDLASGAFKQQAVFWAQRLFPSVRLFEIFHHPSDPPLKLRPDMIAVHFSSVQEAIKRVAPTIQVGGCGESAGWRNRLQSLFASGFHPDFFTLHFYGTHNASTSDDELMKAVRETVSADLPDQVPLVVLGDWLRKLNPPSGLPFQITECSLNALRTPDNKAEDIRLKTSFSAGWFTALFAQMAGKAESIVQYKLVGDNWGLLDEEGNLQPAYWSVWICNTFFRPGTQLCELETKDDTLVALAGKTKTANNLLLVNLTSNSMEVKVKLSEITYVKSVRVRLLRESNPPTYTELKPTATVKITLPPYGVSLLQFVI